MRLKCDIAAKMKERIRRQRLETIFTSMSTRGLIDKITYLTQSSWNKERKKYAQKKTEGVSGPME